MTTDKARVAVLMGSDSDWEVMSAAVRRLQGLGVACDVHVMSAHRTPERVSEYVKGAPARPRISPARWLRTRGCR